MQVVLYHHVFDGFTSEILPLQEMKDVCMSCTCFSGSIIGRKREEEEEEEEEEWVNWKRFIFN
jgi:hypothetical protein